MIWTVVSSSLPTISLRVWRARRAERRVRKRKSTRNVSLGIAPAAIKISIKISAKAIRIAFHATASIARTTPTGSPVRLARYPKRIQSVNSVDFFPRSGWTVWSKRFAHGVLHRLIFFPRRQGAVGFATRKGGVNGDGESNVRNEGSLDEDQSDDFHFEFVGRKSVQSNHNLFASVSHRK